MSEKKNRAARQLIQDAEGQVLSARRKKQFYYPPWRLIIGMIFPSVKTKFKTDWEAKQKAAFRKVKKKFSHMIAKED